VPTNMTTIMLAERCADHMRQTFRAEEPARQQPELVA
jgi:choline dehydrogenase-like flavoprotein